MCCPTVPHFNASDLDIEVSSAEDVEVGAAGAGGGNLEADVAVAHVRREVVVLFGACNVDKVAEWL